MPIAVTEIPQPVNPPDPPRKRWTRTECATLEASGLLDQERRHVNSLTVVHAWLSQVFGWRHVTAEASIDVAPEDNPTNEPVPNLIVLRQDQSHYTSNPQAQDLWLVVEIADTSLTFDLRVNPHFSRTCGGSVNGRFQPGFPQAMSALPCWDRDC